MAVLPIVTYDDKILYEKAEPVSDNSRQLQELIDDMFDTMYNAEGVGLAAPQVGVSSRLFVMDADVMVQEQEDSREEELYGALAMINPEIVSCSDNTVQLEEGCLSIPEVTGPVTRPEEITVTYLNRDFEKEKRTFTGWPARIIQHEHDHLEGTLFLEHLSVFKRKLLGSKLKEIARGEKEVKYPIVPKKAVSS